jgi:capsular polysaccharide biosynthesis protein
MSQQGLDLRRSVQIVRRHKILVSAAIAVGLLGGAGYATLNPPKLSSTALIIVQSSSAQAAGANSAATDPFTATQVVIAGSDSVLTNALSGVQPQVSLETLRKDVSVSSMTPSVITVTAASRSGPQAESMANAVANSYLAEVKAATSPIGNVRARPVQSASAATGTSVVKHTITFVLLGLLLGGVAGFVIALARGKNDRRLRDRDDIANSIGVPVVLSIPLDHPSDAPGWTKLLEEYEPGVVHAWRLRQALQQLGVAEAISGNRNGGPVTVGVLSLSTDRMALALGPHIAAYAASQGIATALVVGPQQDPGNAAALRTACGTPLADSSRRAKYLRPIAAADGGMDPRVNGAILIVAVTVVDSATPQLPEMMPTSATVLAVTSGATTAEQLARVATIAAADDRFISGILVADPDPTDQTTGRIPRLGASARRMSPTRVQGIPTEIRR